MEPRQLLSRMTCALAFCAGLACTVLALDRVLPIWCSPLQRTKLELLEERGEDRDTLFLGPSSMHNGVDPRLFDAASAEQGHPTRSMNLAFLGAHVHSQEWFVDQVLQRRPPGLERIVLQVEGVHERQMMGWPTLTPKMIAWHDVRSTLEVLQLLEARGELSLERVLDHWNACAHNQLGAGRAHPWIAATLGVAEPAPALKPDAYGYKARLASESEAERDRVRMFRRTRPRFQRKILRWRSQVPEVPDEPVLLEKLGRIQRRCDEAGIELIVVTVAGAHEGSPAIPAKEEGQLRTLLRFDDVSENEELFDPEFYFDAQHFNPLGARLFSNRLAEELFSEGRGR